MPQRLYSVLKPVSALWRRREIRLKYQIASYSVYTTSLQRPHDVPTAPLSVDDAFMGRKQLLQRVHSTLTASRQRSRGDDSV